MPTDLGSKHSRSPEGQRVPVARRFRSSLLNGVTGLTVSTLSYLAISRSVAPAEFGRVAVVLAVWGMLISSIEWCGELLMRFGPIELGKHGSMRVTIATRLLFAAP